MPAELPPAPMPSAGESQPQNGMDVPPQPPGGYSKKAVTDLVDAVQMALSAVGKVMKKEMPKVPDVPKEAFVKGMLDMPLPAWLVEEIVTLLGVANEVGGKQEGRYALDVMALLIDDEGLDKLAVALELLAKDKVLLDRMRDALAGSAPAPKEKKAEPKEEVEVVETVEEGPESGAAFM